MGDSSPLNSDSYPASYRSTNQIQPYINTSKITMTEYLTVPGTAKNPSALRKFKTSDVAKVSHRSKVRGTDLKAVDILDQPKHWKLTERGLVCCSMTRLTTCGLSSTRVFM